MKRKIWLIIFIPIVILILGMSVLALTINPNQFKPLLIDKTLQYTGLNLDIKGDIHWQFIPKFGLKFGQTQLHNPKGFKQENLLEIEEMGLSVDLLPLLKKSLVISDISLDGAKLFYQDKGEGNTNLALTQAKIKSLSDTNAATSVQKDSTQANPNTLAQSSSSIDKSEKNSVWSVVVEGLSIKNASLFAINDPMAVTLGFDDLNVDLSDFSPNQWTNLSLSTNGHYNQQKYHLAFDTQFKVNLETQEYLIKDLNATGQYQDQKNNIDFSDLALDAKALAYQDHEVFLNDINFRAKGKYQEISFDHLALKLASLHRDPQNTKLSNLALQTQFMQKLDDKNHPNSSLDLKLDQLMQVDQGYLADNLVLSGTLNSFNQSLNKIQFNSKQTNINLTDTNELLALNLSKFTYLLDGKASTTTSSYQFNQLEGAVNKLNVKWKAAQLQKIVLSSFDLKGGLQTKDLTLSELVAKLNQANLSFDKKQSMNKVALTGMVASSRVKAPNIDLSKLELSIDKLVPNQTGKFNAKVQGQYDGSRINLTQQASLKINSDFNQIRFQKLKVSGQLKGKNIPLSPLKLALQGGLNYQLATKQLDLTLAPLKLNQYQVKGKVSVNHQNAIPKIRYDLTSNTLNLDKLLADLNKKSSNSNQTKTKKVAKNGSSKTTSKSNELAILSELDLDGRAQFSRVITQGVTLNQLDTKIKIQKGILDINRLNAKLFKGSMKTTGRIDGRSKTPKYRLNSTLRSIQVQSLLAQFANEKRLSGTGNLDLKLTGRSFNPDNAIRNLTGSANLSLTNGVIYGVNIPYQIRKTYAQIKGDKIPTEPNQTDFSSLKGLIKFNKGALNTNNLNFKTSVLSVKGQGRANYLNKNMDFKVQASVIGRINDNKGKEIKALRNVTVPVRVYGPWKKLKYQIDLDKLLKTHAASEVKKKAQTKIDKEIERFTGGDNEQSDQLKKAAGSLLNGLFK